MEIIENKIDDAEVITIGNELLPDSVGGDDLREKIEQAITRDYDLVRKAIICPEGYYHSLMPMFKKWMSVVYAGEQDVDITKEIDGLISLLSDIGEDEVDIAKAVASRIFQHYVDTKTSFDEFKKIYPSGMDHIFGRQVWERIMIEMIRMASVVEYINKIPFDESVVKTFLDNPRSFKHGANVYKIIGEDMRKLYYGK